MANLLILAVSLIVLTVVLYFGCTLYLAYARTIPLPLNAKANVAIGVAWLVFAAVICGVAVAGVKLVSSLAPELNNVIGVIPVAVGIGLSVVVRRSEWREFYLKFQNR